MSRDTQSVPLPGGTYPLGDHEVARIGYGAMQLRRQTKLDEAVALLERAIALGVNHIDTAQFYGNGFVNSVIRQVLRPGDGIVVATKVGGDPNPGGKIPVKPAQRPEQLRASVDDNLVSLGLEQLPLVNLRRLDVGPGLSAEGDQVVDIDDQLATMIGMRDEGKIGAIGLSAVSLDGLNRALAAGIACVQNAYSVVSRQFEDMLEFCLTKNIAWAPFFPLGGDFPGSPKVTEQPKVINIAARMNVTPSQVGLAWLLRHAPNIVLIPGTASIEHLEQNIAAASIVLDQDAIADLNSLEAPSTPS
jgi:pyridoxine 4-dehydrogenase